MADNHEEEEQWVEVDMSPPAQADGDITASVRRRIGKPISKDGFLADVAAWEEGIQLLPPYDEAVLRTEIQQWDLSIPNRDMVEFGDYQEAYSRQVAYRERLVAMIDLVHAHAKMYGGAMKSLEKVAYGLGSGTQKEREAFAANAVQDFTRKTVGCEKFLKYLEEMIENIEFNSTQLSRILRHHEALTRISGEHVRGGDAVRYTRLSEEPSPSVRSRPRGFMAEREDWNDDDDL